MRLIQYKGYYDEFKYWSCRNEDCNLENDLVIYESDEVHMGAYA